MKSAITLRVIILALWLNIPSFVMAEGDRLLLKRGLYVDASVSCQEPPFAVMQSWDGVGFHGPHSSGCTTRILSRRGNTFHIATTCTALGDGTPVPASQVNTGDLSLIRLSSSRFTEFSSTKVRRTFRLCSRDNDDGLPKKGKP